MNNSKPSPSKRQQEISRLSKSIEELAIQLNQLILEENQFNQQAEQQDNQQESNGEFQIGDTVEITNNHRGLRGTQGVITNITTHQVSIRAAGHRRVITRKKTNVRKIT
jgi:replicative DNA helicase